VKPPSSPINQISAVTLVTADMARAYAFYTALGFVVRYGAADAAFTSFVVGRGFLNLQLDPAHEPGRRVWGRVIFWVDDVDAVHDRALAAGLRPEDEPADAPWGERYFHLRDPDGHELSFARPLHPG
jgi:catechol 2,3-dioxygenase-like lactoylglutathione lyase family enzyme